MKKFKLIFSMAAVVLATVGVAGVTQITKAEENKNAVIPSKVYIGEVSVGGMTVEDAKNAVSLYVDGLMDTQVTLRAGENEIKTTAGELGVAWSNHSVTEEAARIGKVGNLIQRYKDTKDLEYEDKVFEIEYSVDREVLSAWLDANAQQLNQDAVDNGLKREDGAFIFIEGQEGIEVNVLESAECVAAYLEEEWNGTAGTISLVADLVEPKGSREELGSIQDVLGSYHTYFGDSASGRMTNVKHATSFVDGTLLFPGEEFSAYDKIAPLDAENGYELGGAYENGTVIESYGGGVCQVSTTLYNAAIRAELEITERFNHSMIVTYVEPSMDAAIAGTYKNLRFINSLDTPIYIEGYTEGGVLYFNIYGKETRPANRKVSFVSEVLSEEDPAPKFQASEEPIGTITRTQSVHVGNTAQLVKIVTVDGVEESREVFNTSKYNPSPAIYDVGVSSGNPEAVAKMNEALATQDEATIRAAAEYWSDEAVAARAQAEADAKAKEEEDKKKEDKKKEDKKKEENKKDDKKNNDKKKDEADGDDESESE